MQETTTSVVSICNPSTVSQTTRVFKCPKLLCTPGKNFLLYKYDQHLASANGIGSKNSTFLGMREVSAVATLIHAEVSLIFEEHSAVTTLQLPYVKVLSSIKLAIPEPILSTSELAAPAPAEGCISIAEVLDYCRIIFFCCDDDMYPCTTYITQSVVDFLIEPFGAGHHAKWQYGCFKL